MVKKIYFIESLTENEMTDIYETVLEEIRNYIDEFVLQTMTPNFHDELVQDITQCIVDQWTDEILDEDYEEIQELVKLLLTIIMIMVLHKHHHVHVKLLLYYIRLVYNYNKNYSNCVRWTSLHSVHPNGTFFDIV